jgi:hypothetical protein
MPIVLIALERTSPLVPTLFPSGLTWKKVLKKVKKHY